MKPSLSPALAGRWASTAARGPTGPYARHFATAPSPPQPRRPRTWALPLTLAIALPTAYLLGSAYPPQTILFILPRPAPPPPLADSAEGRSYAQAKEDELQRLGLVTTLRDKEGWYESRPYARFDANKVHNNLTAGSLRGPGKLGAAPIVFAKRDESEAIAIVHFGRALCGHDGIVHGGLIATVFDETLARNGLWNLPSKIGVTANLNVNYRAPCMADQTPPTESPERIALAWIVIRTKLDSIQGRKTVVSGTMETLKGEKVAEATGLFVEPRWAAMLKRSGVTEALGDGSPLTPRPTGAVGDKPPERVV